MDDYKPIGRGVKKPGPDDMLPDSNRFPTEKEPTMSSSDANLKRLFDADKTIRTRKA